MYIYLVLLEILLSLFLTLLCLLSIRLRRAASVMMYCDDVLPERQGSFLVLVEES